MAYFLPPTLAYPADPTDTDLHRALRFKLLRAFFGIVTLLATLGAVAAPLLGGQLPWIAQLAMVLGYGTLALASLAATRLPLQATQRLVSPVILGGLLLVGVIGALSGWALQTPGLAFFGMVVCIAYVAGPPRLGPVSAALAVGLTLALGLAERIGWFPSPIGAPALAARLVIQCAAIVAGALSGRAVTALLHLTLAAATAREQRFQALLGIATTAYWETDATLHLSHASWRDAGGRFVPVTSLLGQRPWEVSSLTIDPAVTVQVREAMRARQPLRDLPFSWRAAAGSNGDGDGHSPPQHYLASGEPRFDNQGCFAGYWGVARNVSAEHQARTALAATESTYQTLFNLIPIPLALHRQGVVLDANPAAARLLGYGSVAAMLGHDLLAEHVVEAQGAVMRERVAALESALIGVTAEPLAITLRTCQGTLRQVTSVGLRTDVGGAPAVLSISIDETDRHAAAQALEGSQALLAQVVALSPDVIALTQQPEGRYVMINQSFARLLGYAASEVVGRTATELGLWRHAADRQRVLQAAGADGTVRDLPVDFVAKGGQVVPLMFSCTYFISDGQAYLLTNARDISDTARARLEREAILANASVGIAFTRNRCFEMANAQFERMFGWPPGGLVGQPGRVVWASDADYKALARDAVPLLARGESIDLERRAARRDGSSFLMRVRAKAIDPDNPAGSGTIWIAEDVTAQREAAQALAAALQAAEAASRAKSAFLANTSHELRTPLNGLTGLAWLARQPGVPPERLQRYLDQIGDSAALLSTIISDILDMAKIEAGKLALEDAPFDLAGLLGSLAQDNAALAGHQGLAFETVFDAGLPAWVCGDALRLRQILANFLHNALKFTASGSIRLVARPVPAAGPDAGGAGAGGSGVLRFEVHDTGPGIAEDVQARLFKPFTQADGSTTRRYGGTGLGLSICRELATLMGGQVGLHSRPGQGSCFYLALALPAAPAPGFGIAGGAASEARLRGVRVLLVEDNTVNMMIGVAVLAHWGVEVTEALDGPQALAAVADAAAAGQPFDVVLMDLQMPGMSGFEATELLRRQYSAAQLPVIALTAAALVSERERALAIGMADFVTKPIEPPRLHAALLRVLRV